MNINNLIMTLDFCEDSAPMWGFIGRVMKAITIGIVVILVVMVVLDLGKIVIQGDEKKMQEQQKTLIKRLIYAAVIFFVPYIVGAVFSLVSKNWESTAGLCWDCALNPNSDERCSALE